MLKFQKIRYKNILSTGNIWIEIFLNKSTTTLIQGKNGSGKSTILDAIFFALYGKPFRNINIPTLVNSITAGDCMVELFLTVGKNEIKIVRGLKPKTFEIYVNDVLVPQSANKRDYQKVLEDDVLGGFPENIARQIVVMGSADYVPFMQLKAESRRQVIEELLDIKIFSKMGDLAKNKLSSIKTSLEEIDKLVDLVKEKINIHIENEKQIAKEASERKLEIEQKIFDEETAEKVLVESLNFHMDKRDKLKLAIGNKRQKMIDERNTLTRNVGRKEDQIDALYERLVFFKSHTACETCSQEIPWEHNIGIQTKLVAEIETYTDELKLFESLLKDKDDALAIVNEGINKLEAMEKEIYKKQTEIASKQRYIFTLQDDLKSVKTVNITLTTQLNELEEELDSLKVRRLAILEENQYYNAISGMLKDGGIKTKIIRQYIPVMNKIINEYLVRFGLPIEFTLDEQFDEVIKSRYRDNFKYNNFSEGEKQRIDMALLLAWRQIAKSKNTTNTNLLIMDETFDSSLDAAATEELLNILLEMDKNTNIFIISHKSDLGDKLRSQMTFEKFGNFTRMVKEK